MISGLLKKLEKFPPIDVIAAGWLKQNEPKPIGEQIGSVGIPVKKGKVKKRGNVSG